MDAPHVCDPISEGKACIKKSKTWLPPPLVLVLGDANIAMVDAAISRILSEIKDLQLS